MWCEFNYKGKWLKISYPSNKSWIIDHIQKHIIDNYYNEGWNNVLDYDKSIDDINLNDNKKLEIISENYLNVLKQCIENDYLKPRNAIYSFNDKGSYLHYTIISNEGFCVIIRKYNQEYVLVTGYGYSDLMASEMSLKFKKLYSDTDWRCDQMIGHWNQKFITSKYSYKNVEKHISENWETS